MSSQTHSIQKKSVLYSFLNFTKKKNAFDLTSFIWRTGSRLYPVKWVTRVEDYISRIYKKNSKLKQKSPRLIWLSFNKAELFNTKRERKRPLEIVKIITIRSLSRDLTLWRGIGTFDFNFVTWLFLQHVFSDKSSEMKSPLESPDHV